MDPHESLQLQSGEASISLEVGLVVLAIGAMIGVYLVCKLIGEYRARKAQRDRDDAPSRDEATDSEIDESSNDAS